MAITFLETTDVQRLNRISTKFLTRAPYHDLIPRKDVNIMIKAVRKVIEEGVQETEGKYKSHKNNKCRHGQFGYEGCDQCTCEFLEKALSEFQSKHGESK